ncbi:GNAT family N-acetyltransferase [Streptomyces noursei]
MDRSLYRVRPVAPRDIAVVQELTELCHEHDEGNGKDPSGWKVLVEHLLSPIPNPIQEHAVILVAEEVATRIVVGVVTAGPAGKWAVELRAGLRPEALEQFNRRVGEIYEVAVHPDHRRRGIGCELMNEVCGSSVGRRWWLGLWFFHDQDAGAAAFHGRMAPLWPQGNPLMVLEPGGSGVIIRYLNNGMRAVFAPFRSGVEVVQDLRGVQAIAGLFTGVPWTAPRQRRGAAHGARSAKALRKQEKKARGRARG